MLMQNYHVMIWKFFLYDKQQHDSQEPECRELVATEEQIDLQPPVSCVSGIHMEGTVVEVCLQNCTQCGDPATETGVSEWAIFNCRTPILGDKISISNNDILTFCEIEIHAVEN